MLSPDDVVNEILEVPFFKKKGLVRVNDIVFSTAPSLHQVHMRVNKNGLFIREISWGFPYSDPIMDLYVESADFCLTDSGWVVRKSAAPIKDIVILVKSELERRMDCLEQPILSGEYKFPPDVDVRLKRWVLEVAEIHLDYKVDTQIKPDRTSGEVAVSVKGAPVLGEVRAMVHSPTEVAAFLGRVKTWSKSVADTISQVKAIITK